MLFFRFRFGKHLPVQEYGVDCGIFVILYFYYIASNAVFDFKTVDMILVRKWLLALLVKGAVMDGTQNYVHWLTTKMNSNRIGSLKLESKLQIKMEDLLKEKAATVEG